MVETGIELSTVVFRGFVMDFCIGKPFEYDNDGFDGAPEFRPFANKVMIYLLWKVERPEWNSIRPRSLKATTISALMTEGAQGSTISAQLSTQFNYRNVAAQDMEVYSRNVVHQQLPVSNFARPDFEENRAPSTLAKGRRSI